MNVQNFIPRIEAAGFTLRVDGSDLVVRPFSRLSETQRRFIKAHKPELVRLLAGRPAESD